MGQTPFEYAEGLRIGTVEFVSPDEIKVSLDIEAPNSLALNAGTPRVFPQVNSYVLIPNDEGYLVGQVDWVTIERSAFPKRRGMLDFGVIDIPYPQRKMSLNPLGTLKKKSFVKDKGFKFQRGADSFPIIGDGVFIPTDYQLRSIIESGDNRRVKIGSSPIAGNADVCIDPNRLFGRHLAVLGNTGSGKSCSVAGIIRWCLEAAQETRGKNPNARFIILDPNGEYSRAFSKKEEGIKSRTFTINPKDGELPLHVPLWFWNSAEWCSFTQASGKAQKPTLTYALQNVRTGKTAPFRSHRDEIRSFLKTIIATLRIEMKNGTPWAEFPKPKSFCDKIEKLKTGFDSYLTHFSGDEYTSLNGFSILIDELLIPRKAKYPHYDFTIQEVENLISCAITTHHVFGGSDKDIQSIDIDAPCEFSGESFVLSIEATAEMLNVSQYVETLVLRIKSMLANTRMKKIIVDDSDCISLDQWLTDIVGGEDASNGSVTIIDLSLIPTEVIHVTVAVIARIVFEALQRYHKLNGFALPTVLVMEEAHTFIKRYPKETDNQDTASICCQIFEKIAQEGRKFGLGLVLSSQRPSELSPTVLSQCNTFLLHRISNDRDQDLVSRFIPDNLKGLLRELPILPSQNAILLGWASELPLLVRMNDLPREHRPYSDDPDYWSTWIGCDQQGEPINPGVNWKEIADDWQGKSSQ